MSSSSKDLSQSLPSLPQILISESIVRSNPPQFVARPPPPFTVPEHSRNQLVQAAARLTQDSCRLLGIKSLGVDYGLVRTGVALTVGYEPIPLAILTSTIPTVTSTWNATTVSYEKPEPVGLLQRQHELCEQIIQLARSHQVSRIIVGLPFHKNGTVALQTNLTLAFGHVLARSVLSQLGPTVTVFGWDERYTSKEAATRVCVRAQLRAERVVLGRDDWYGALDADAAGIILESYYHENGENAQEIKVLDEECRRECLEQYEKRKANEELQRRVIMEQREERINRRKQAIARAQSMETECYPAATIKKKKRKKK